MLLLMVSQILCKRRFGCKTEHNFFKAGAAASSSCLVYKVARLRGRVNDGGVSPESIAFLDVLQISEPIQVLLPIRVRCLAGGNRSSNNS